MKNTYPRVENAQHIIVYQEDGKFLGWPANEGAWTADGVNMLVGFAYGEYQLNKNHHNITGRVSRWLARSTDMGLTWTAWDPDGYVGDFGNTPKRQTLKNAIDLSHPQFAMSVVGYHSSAQDDDRSHFFYSDDAVG